MTIKSIVINGKTILSTPNAINEGVWFDMLEVHQAAGLPANKTFSQWRSRQSRALEDPVWQLCGSAGLPYVGGPYSLAGGGLLRCV